MRRGDLYKTGTYNVCVDTPNHYDCTMTDQLEISSENGNEYCVRYGGDVYALSLYEGTTETYELVSGYNDYTYLYQIELNERGDRLDLTDLMYSYNSDTFTRNDLDVEFGPSGQCVFELVE